MSASWYWARATLRRNLRGAALVVLLVAVGGGATMALAAGARRTESSYRRLVAVSNEFDGVVYPDSAADGQEGEDVLRALVASPLVADAVVVSNAFAVPVGVKCVGGSSADFYALQLPLDGGDPYRISRPRVLSGRFPRPGVADEVALPEIIAARLGLVVGDELRLFVPATPDDCRDEATSARQPPAARLRVVGVVRHAYELGQRPDDSVPTFLPRAFGAAHPEVPVEFPLAYVRLHGGPGAFAAFAAEARRAGGGAETGTAPEGAVQPALDTASTGLWVAAGVVALATLGALALALVRQADGLAGDLRVLGALGVSRRVAAAGAAAPGALALGLGVAAALVVATAASASFPIGLGRRAEPHLGLHADWAVLATGALAALMIGFVSVGLAAWRAVRVADRVGTAGGSPRASRLLGLLRRAGMPPWATIGSGYALGTGRGARVSAGAVAGAIVGVTGVVAVTLFGLSLDRAITEPRRYGWGDWDGVVKPDVSEEGQSPEADAADDARLEALVLADPAVEAVSLVRFRSELVLDGEPVRGLVVFPRRGRAGPTVVSGRLPERSGEIALGAGTARRFGVGVGDRVRAGTGDTASLDVVGLAAFPAGEDGLAVSDGFVVPGDWWVHQAYPATCEEGCFRQHAVVLAQGADVAAFAGRMARQGAYVTQPEPGGEVRRLHEVQALPRILAVLLGLVAFLGLAHTLWVTPRRRRRGLATLRALGFTPAQVRRVLHTQAAVLAAAGVAGGLIAGVIAGRLAWEAAAQAIGVPDDLSVRLLPHVFMVAAALTGARLLAVIPGRVAGRATPARGVRGEG